MSVRVAVVGGGLAGIAAALRCADAGRRSPCSSRGRGWAGATGSFRAREPGGRQRVSTSSCAAAPPTGRCWSGSASRAGHLQRRLDMPVLAPGAATPGCAAGGLPAPLHLAGTLLRYHPLPPADRLRLAAARLAHCAASTSPTPPPTGAASPTGWPSTGRAGRRRRLWDLICVATLNAPAGDASLALAATVFQVGPARPRPPPATSAGRGSRSGSCTATAARRRWPSRRRGAHRDRVRALAGRPPAGGSPAIAADGRTSSWPTASCVRRAPRTPPALLPLGARHPRVGGPGQLTDRQRPRGLRPAGDGPSRRRRGGHAGAVRVRPHRRAGRTRGPRPVPRRLALGSRRTARPAGGADRRERAAACPGGAAAAARGGPALSTPS